MCVRLAVAVWVGAGWIASFSQPAAAQADVHARAIARASCQSGKHSDAVVDAKTAIDHDPDQLGPRMRLADALVDQGCYQEAVEILDAAQEVFPRNAELTGKLRDVRSLVTEQTYIEGLTQAAESAKVARNQLRCTKLGDVAACEDALRAKPDDAALLTAKGDALMQANQPADAATAYRHVSQLKPGDEAVKTKLSSAEALEAKSQPPPPAALPPEVAGAPSARGGSLASGAPSARGPASAADALAATNNAPKTQRAARTSLAQPNGGQHLAAAPAVAALAPSEIKTYSNDAPPGQTN